MRTSATAFVAAVVLATAAPAVAGTRSEIDAATARMSVLETRIADKEREVTSAGRSLRERSAEVDARRADAADVQRRLKATRARLDRERRTLDGLRDRLADRARAMYVRGPSGPLQLFLGAESLGELQAKSVYAVRLIAADTQLSLDVRRAAAALEDQKSRETLLLVEKARLVKDARRREDAVEDAFSRQRRALREMLDAKVELTTLIGQLRDRLRAEQLSSAIRAAGRGTPLSFGEWSAKLLEAVGAPATRDNLVVVVAWQAAEYTAATWNPLATTMPMAGATTFNSHGVKNYDSLEMGIEATLRTLSRPGHGYDKIVASLRAGSDAMTTAQAINASNWCRGCAGGSYVTGLIPAVEANYERYAAA